MELDAGSFQHDDDEREFSHVLLESQVAVAGEKTSKPFSTAKARSRPFWMPLQPILWAETA